MNQITANGQAIPAKLPCTIEEFIVSQGLLPRSVVVEQGLPEFGSGVSLSA